MKKKNPLAIEIGSRIAACRHALNLTQEQLEERSGVSQNHISCMERGLSVIGAEALIKLAPALQVSSDYLLTGKGDQAVSPQLHSCFRWASELSEEKQETIRKILEELRNMMEE